MTIFLTHPPAQRRLYYPEQALEGLRRLGAVRTHEGDASLSPDELVAAARDCTIIVADRGTPLPAQVFEALPDLAALVRSAVDTRNIDIEAASRAGVLVTHASPGFVDAVVELIIGFMVDLGRGISDAVLSYRRGEEARPRVGVQLAGKTLGIVGYGAIGRRLAELGGALRMRVLVSDPYKRVDPPGPEQTGFADLLSRADFVVCLAIASDETESLFDAEAFAAMKPGAFFVNPSRGGLVDEAALEAALESGRLAGAALDVGRHADQKPLPHIARLENVIATPHIGGLTPEATAHQALETVEQVAAILRGKIPAGAINAESARRPGRHA